MDINVSFTHLLMQSCHGDFCLIKLFSQVQFLRVQPLSVGTLLAEIIHANFNLKSIQEEKVEMNVHSQIPVVYLSFEGNLEGTSLVNTR